MRIDVIHDIINAGDFENRCDIIFKALNNVYAFADNGYRIGSNYINEYIKYKELQSNPSQFIAYMQSDVNSDMQYASGNVYDVSKRAKEKGEDKFINDILIGKLSSAYFDICYRREERFENDFEVNPTGEIIWTTRYCKSKYYSEFWRYLNTNHKELFI